MSNAWDPEDWVEDRDRLAGWQAERLEDGYVPVDPDGAPEVGDETSPWQVVDDSAAEWCLRKIARAHRELRRLEAVADAETSAIRAWLDQASAGPARTIEFFESKLVDYRRRLEADDPDLPKTYRLPAGELVRRAGRVRSTVTDPEAFCAWALAEAPEAVTVKPTPGSIVRSDRFEATDDGAVVDTTTGEIVPGLVVVRGEDTYGVKVR